MPHVWTISDYNFLRENAAKMTRQELSDILGVSHDAVRHAAKRLRLKIKPHAYRPWTPEEDDLLVGFMDRGIPYAAMATKLNRDMETVRRRVMMLRSEGLIGPSARVGRPPDEPHPFGFDELHVEAILAEGGFKGLQFKPGRVFAYRNGERLEVML